jgi:sporulation protein YlmC with PRC-barrel domain
MLKKLMVTTAVSGLMMTGALAQETTTPPVASPPPAMSKETPTPPAASPPPAMTRDRAVTDATTTGVATTGKFVSVQGTDQLAFSKFKGTDVIGPDNAHVGDVSDILFEKNGKVIALIVGVGGFLGIGEKNVAIDMSAFEVMPADAGVTNAVRAATDDPTKIKLKVSWTKDQLKAAPDFEYYKPTRTSATTPPVPPPARTPTQTK